MGYQIDTTFRHFEFALYPSDAHTLAESLRDFEYAYNLLMYCSGEETHAYLDRYGVARIIAERGQYGVEFTNVRLREKLRTGDGMHVVLHVESIHSGSPINIEFAGVSKAITALASIFDPQQRKKLKNEIQAKQQQDRISEEKARLEIVGQKIKLLKELAELEKSLGRYTDDKEFSKKVTDTILSELTDVVSKQMTHDVSVKALPSPNDPER